MNITFLGYHTCHLEGSLNTIFKDSPYKSREDVSQWLGYGYYFWTDSDYFADKWGKRKSKYPRGYAITEYLIDIPKDLLLDLVGNVKDQLVFRDQILLYAERMGLELKNKEDALKIPISKVLDHLRLQAQKDKNMFPFNAIKAMDYNSIDTLSYKFTDDCKQKEKIPIPSRQQLYLKDLSFLKRKSLIHVQNFNANKYKPIMFDKGKFIFEYNSEGRIYE
ncbi:hypothetical protein Q7381_04190 [Glaesserella parasuis]|nr:hypothetical protein [Glaesserella parasuis]MDP0119573.1 hypothetical protein [Glaesserella parasuis]